ncbi:MAG: hypothetical protein ACK4L7_09110 [Flavobacteriales bacterium]
MRRINRFMEHFWAAVAIGTLLAALWSVAAEGFEKGAQWFFFPAIAAAMWGFRRITRRKLEAMEERDR